MRQDKDTLLAASNSWDRNPFLRTSVSPFHYRDHGLQLPAGATEASLSLSGLGA